MAIHWELSWFGFFAAEQARGAKALIVELAQELQDADQAALVCSQ